SRTAFGLRSVGVSSAAFRRAFASVVVIASPVFWLLEKMVESVHPARFGTFNISADPFVPSNKTLALKPLEKGQQIRVDLVLQHYGEVHAGSAAADGADNPSETPRGARM